MPKTKIQLESISDVITVDNKNSIKFNVNQLIWVVSKLNLKTPAATTFSAISLSRKDPTYVGFSIKGPLKITSIKLDMNGIEYKANDDFTYSESSIFESLELAVNHIKQFNNLN